MSFNSDFWVTIGTTAPVISLSCILLINDQSKILASRQSGKVFIFKRHVRIRTVITISYMINSLNLLLQAILFYNALDGLATRANFSPERVTAGVEAFGVFLLLFSTILIIASNLALKNDEDRRLAREKTEARRLVQEKEEARRLDLKQLSISRSRKIFRAANSNNVGRAAYRRRDFPSRRA